MIRHRPLGSENPYSTTFDQAVPAHPSDGDPVRLWVRAAAAVTAVECEWEARSGDGRVEVLRLPLAPKAGDDGTRGGAGVTGHLAAIQERGISDRGAWGVDVGRVCADVAYRYRFRASSSDGRGRTTRWFDLRVGRWSGEGGTLVVEGAQLVVPGSVEWWDDGTGPRRVRFALPLRAGEHVVGFGERFEAFDQRGRALDARVFEQYKGQDRAGRTYLPMPFAHVVGPSGGGWGFCVLTTARTWYDVGRSDPDRLVVEAELDPSSPALGVVVRRGTPYEVLSDFLDRCGRATELPEWVFRLWASDNEWNSQAAVMRELDRHRAEDIDVGVVVIEAWSDESTFAAFGDAVFAPAAGGAPHRLSDFSFPPEGAWPDPVGLVRELHARDCRVLLWQIPLIKMRPPPRGQLQADVRHALERRFVVEESDGRPYRNRGAWFPTALMPDLRDAEVARWWTERLRYLVAEVGVDGFKTDGGEHAWGDDLRYRDGATGLTANNELAVAYPRAFAELLRSEGKAPVTFSRAGFAGSQATGVIWAGDEDSSWQAMRSSLTAGLTAAACGVVYWAWDLAGFSGPVPDPELYLRAAAVSAFVPVMQYHAEFNFHRRASRARTPWNVAQTHGDPSVVPLFREIVQLRRRLTPYLAEQAQRACELDRPLMRPLFFDHAADPQIWSWPLQFQLGDELLVSPVTEPGATRWPTYLPSGQWVDAWTGMPHTGGGVVMTDAPPGRVPVFARASSWEALRPVFEG
ncbi:MAG TPA: TIM-barrel domain-containing protein [Cellulomonas sp.]